MKRWVIGAVIVAAVGGLTALAVSARNSGDAEDSEEPQYSNVKVERGKVREEVSCSSATVTSNLDVEIKCKASGEITALPFDISQTVQKGDLLVELDPIDEERSVKLAQVQLQASEAKLAQAEQNLKISIQELESSRREASANLASAEAGAQDKREKAERMAALLEKEYASEEETETAKTDAAQAKASLDLAHVSVSNLRVEEEKLELLRQDIALAKVDVEADRISLQNAEQRLKETKVYAPMAGVISDRMVQTGQIISSPTNNVSGGTELLTLSDLSRIFVLASIDESDIGKIAVGQAATVTVDAFPDTPFKGEVVRVATKGANVSNVVTFEVKVEILDESKDRLRPEMTADVEILCGEKDSALLVPIEAVRGVGIEKYVLTPAPQGQEPGHVPVTTGLTDDTNIEIEGELKEGDVILLPQDGQDSQWKRETSRGMGPPPPF